MTSQSLIARRVGAEAADGQVGSATVCYLTVRLLERLHPQNPVGLSDASIRYQAAALAECADSDPTTAPVVRNLIDAVDESLELGELVGGVWEATIDLAMLMGDEVEPDLALHLTDVVLANPLARSHWGLAHGRRGRFARIAGQFTTSLEESSKGMEFATAAGNETHYWIAQLARVNTLSRMGNLKQAEQECRETVAAVAELDDNYVKAQASHSLGFALNESGRHSEAIPWLFRAFELNDDPLLKGRALSDIALSLKQLGYLEGAVSAFLAARTLCDTMETEANLVLELLDLSYDLDRRDLFDEAHDFLVTRINRLTPDQLVDFHTKMAAVSAAKHDGTAFDEHRARAIAIAEEHGVNKQLFDALALEPKPRVRPEDLPEEVLSVSRRIGQLSR